MTEPKDIAESFLQLFALNEPAIRAFIRACVFRPSDVDEVMQEVSLVAWRKFPDLQDRQMFLQWACLIARYEILMFRRRHSRDRLVLDEDLIETIAAEGAEEGTRRQRQLLALDECIEKLPAERRVMLQAAYAPGAIIKSVAAQFNRTEGAFYQILDRIRMTLLRCVETTLAGEGR